MRFDKSIPFYKYHGTGNDFIIIDNRNQQFAAKCTERIHEFCDRRFGIGADGLILLENDNLSDFKMVYYNSDGNQSTMCGNGGRCIVAFAKELGIIVDNTTFSAVDGLHKAEIDGDLVTLNMVDVRTINSRPKHFFLDTGSPHHVQLVADLDEMDVKSEGARLRYGLYGQQGSNINFVEQVGNTSFKVRTYERGVEDETFSCGTGVTAVALAMHHGQKTDAKGISIQTKGGDLEVRFKQINEVYTSVQLIGPAKMVFKGEISC